MAILAALGAPRFDGRPWLLVAVLAGTAVAGLAVAVAIDRVRQRTTPLRRTLLDLALLAGVVALAVWAPPRRTLLRLNEIVAGERATQDRVIRHQVWAAYRRMDKEDERRLMERGEAHAAMVEAAALAFGIDPELLMGVAATESSFLPRDSADGGRGLFQITAVPAAATEGARRVLGVERIDLLDDRQNATVAAATLAGYAAQMKGDLFLTLLAYNIGGLFSLLPFFDETKPVMFVAISFYLGVTAIFIALAMQEDTSGRLRALEAGYILAALLASLAAMIGFFDIAGLGDRLTRYDGTRASGTRAARTIERNRSRGTRASSGRAR